MGGGGRKGKGGLTLIARNWLLSCRSGNRPMGLFSLYLLFSHFRPRDVTPGNSFFQMSSYARAHVRITYEKTKGKFPWEHHVV